MASTKKAPRKQPASKKGKGKGKGSKPRVAVVRHRRTPKKDDLFFRAIAADETVKVAADLAGYPRARAYEWRRNDPEFRERWDRAIEESTQSLEREAVRRAKGWEESRIDKDGNVTTVHKYSDVLLIFMLKSRRPHIYRDQVDVNVNHNVVTHVNLVPVVGGKVMTNEEVAGLLPAQCQEALLAAVNPREGEEDG